MKHLQDATTLQTVVATDIKEYFPASLRFLFTLLMEKKGGDRVRLRDGDIWFQECLRQHASAAPPEAQIDGGDPALLLCTGGTTGTPKAAIQTHRALLITGMQGKTWSGPSIPDDTSTVLLAIPLFHTYGNSLLLPTTIVGRNAAALVPNPQDLDDVIRTIEKVRPTTVPGIPALYIKLLEHRKVKAGKVNLRSIKSCLSSAAPLLAETKRRFEAQTGGKLIEGYGLTESCCAFTANPFDGLYKTGSVGIPVPDVEVRIVDADSGRNTLPAGEVGELVMRAPNLMSGYWGSPDETKDALRDGWLHTGDLGYMDEDGYVFVVDRKKDVIKPSGFQVWPREVEEVLASHPAVTEVAVAGVPDAVQGESVKAWVVAKPGASVDAEDLRALYRQHLAAYKVPKHVEFRNAIPKTTTGKVLRRTLREEARKVSMH